MSIKVDASGALRKMNALANVLKRPVRDVLDTAARATAIEMARLAAPFGTGDDARSSGEKAVVRDIYKVYGSARGVFEAILDKRMARAFWKHFKNGEFEKATEIAHNAGVKIARFDGGVAHRGLRDNRGHVRQRKPAIFIIDPGERKNLNGYILIEKSHVGTAKGGFADIVRSTSGRIRGLRERGGITANWITRKGVGFGQSFRGGGEENPTLRIVNRVRYADGALTPSKKAQAIQEGYRRAIEALKHAVKAETSRLKRAA